MTEAVYTERTLYVVANADGDITADVDRQTAIDQMCEDYGGDIYRVFELKIKLPRDYPTGRGLRCSHDRDDAGLRAFRASGLSIGRLPALNEKAARAQSARAAF